MVHIGSKIKEVHKASGLSVTAFAKKINTSRRNVYMIFGRASVDTALLVCIGEVLGHDFFGYYITGLPGETTTPPQEDDRPASLAGRLTRLEKEMAALKEAVDRLGEKTGRDNGVPSGN